MFLNLQRGRWKLALANEKHPSNELHSIFRCENILRLFAGFEFLLFADVSQRTANGSRIAIKKLSYNPTAGVLRNE